MSAAARQRSRAVGHSCDLTLMLQSLLRKGMLEKQGGDRPYCYRLSARGAAANFVKSGMSLLRKAQSNLDSGPHASPDTSSAPSSGTTRNARHGRPEPAENAKQTGRRRTRPGNRGSALPKVPGFVSATSSATRRDTRPDTSSAIEDAIVAACAGAFLTVTQITEKTGYSRITVRRRLPSLVRSGRLVRRHAGQPRHPHQAYRAASSRERSKGNST